MSMKLGNPKNKNKIVLTIFVFCLIVFGTVVVLKMQNYQTVPKFIQTPRDTPTYIQITLVRVAFEDEDTFIEINWEDRYFLPMQEFYKKASSGRAVLSYEEIDPYKANHTEQFYGTDAYGLRDNEVDVLRAELEDFWHSSHVVVAIHSGIAQNLKNGNVTGITDQYFGSQTGFQDGIIVLSQYSPYGVLTHEIGHYLGLPDLYGDSDQFLNQYGLMGTGMWHSFDEQASTHGTDGTSPSDLCAWSKLQLGWLDYWNATNSRTAHLNLHNVVVLEDMIFEYYDDPYSTHPIYFGGVFTLDYEFTTRVFHVMREDDTYTYITQEGNKYEFKIDLEDNLINIRKLLNFNLSFEDVFSSVSTIVFIAIVVGTAKMLVTRLSRRSYGTYR